MSCLSHVNFFKLALPLDDKIKSHLILKYSTTYHFPDPILLLTNRCLSELCTLISELFVIKLSTVKIGCCIIHRSVVYKIGLNPN